jgi:hypothetical protein
MENWRTKIKSVLMIILAWFIAVALIYIFILKLKVFSH